MIQWKDDSIIVTKDTSEKVVIVPTKEESINNGKNGEGSLNFLISYHQANRWMKKKGSETFLLYVTDSSDEAAIKDAEGKDIS